MGNVRIYRFINDKKVSKEIYNKVKKGLELRVDIDYSITIQRMRTAKLEWVVIYNINY